MKKIISTIVATAMLLSSTSAFADEHDQRWGVDRNRNSPYHGRTYDRVNHGRRGGTDTGTVIAVGLGALLLGSAIANANRKHDTEDRQTPRYIPRTVCRNEYAHDEYGNVVYDYNGQPQVIQRCWQQ